MCWSEGASLAMVGVGAVATVVTWKGGDPPAIPITLAFFASMEALQVWGYQTIDQCELTGNRASALLSYVHISLQPLFINAFGMAIMGGVSARMWRTIMGLTAVISVLLLMRMVPMAPIGPCVPGTTLCGPQWCTLSGTWHLAWDMPLSDFAGRLGGDVFRHWVPFPDYLLAVFIFPLFYGAWRFALVHAALGPILAASLTANPNEMPAVWCLFSVGLVLISLTPWIRRTVTA
jgi:hypothetical protein